MPKLSAGILAFRRKPNIEVLLVHPGGPVWSKKDLGVWSIPKGEYNDEEEPLTVAKREFEEETGNTLPEGDFIPLGKIRYKSGKTIYAWAIEADFEKPFIKSNLFEMEWPPRTGNKQWFPEVDNAAWFTLEHALPKIKAEQALFLDELKKNLI